MAENSSNSYSGEKFVTAAGGQQPPSPPSSPPDYKSATAFPGALVTIVIVISFVVICCLGVLGIWLWRRKRKSRLASAGKYRTMGSSTRIEGERAVITMIDDDEEEKPKSSPRKLQKKQSREVYEIVMSKGMVDACGVVDEGPMGRRTRHLSLFLGGNNTWFGQGGHTRSRSEVCGLERGFSNRERPGWLDDDVLHGPRRRSGSGLPEILGGGLPTLPRVYHHHQQQQSGPYGGSWEGSEEALLGSDRVRGYGNLRAFSKEVPEIPGRVCEKLLGNSVRSGTRASLVGYCGSKDGGDKKMQRAGTVLSHAGQQQPTARALPMTPTKGHRKNDSTDTILTEILKSTEKRLRSGSVGTMNTCATGHVRKRSASRIGGGVQKTVSRSRTPSPRKYLPPQPSTPGRHKREESGGTVVSGDSFMGDPEGMVDSPCGLTSPNRNNNNNNNNNNNKRESVMSSASSSLSTVFSEDEMPEEVRKAIMPLHGFVVKPQQPATNIKPPVYNDPFVTAPAPLFNNSRPKTSHGWPPAAAYRRMTMMTTATTLGQFPPRGELILAPGPGRYSLKPQPHHHPLPKTPSTEEIIGVPFLPNAPPPSPASPSSKRKSKAPSGPLFLRLTKTSTLSTIPVLPPPIAPGFRNSERRKTMSPIKTVQFSLPPEEEEEEEAENLPPLPPSPTRGLLTPKQQKHASVTSSIYSQDDSVSSPPGSGHAPSSPIDIAQISSPSLMRSLNEAAVSRNSSINPGTGTPKLLFQQPQKEQQTPQQQSEEERKEEEEPLPLAQQILSLRRQNSQMSSSSSLMSIIPDRSNSIIQSPSSLRPTSPLRVLSGLGKKRSPLTTHPNSNPNHNSNSSPSLQTVKTMGSRNYLVLRGHKRGKSSCGTLVLESPCNKKKSDSNTPTAIGDKFVFGGEEKDVVEEVEVSVLVPKGEFTFSVDRGGGKDESDEEMAVCEWKERQCEKYR
ncbi:hypothetical protein QBC38DRAFT_474324 [Podospora fimiseda]|uniref:Uncharacterized protein n=1 Tax=Podospora fimiseda TaxID=252190 RepID=A0AAN7H469_9PEZI|nr:hypothetical protein QBC38DRAFT_474324 [Podospora fimiseda]